MISARAALEATVVGLCAYEVAAITSRYRIPPLTAISRRYRWLAPVLVGGLAVHLYLDAWRRPSDLGGEPLILIGLTDDDPWGEL